MIMNRIAPGIFSARTVLQAVRIFAIAALCAGLAVSAGPTGGARASDLEPADQPDPAPASGTEAPAPHSPPDPHDPRTPAGAVRSFIDDCRDGDFEAAARYLELGGAPADGAPSDGPKLARWLKVVLDRRLWIDFATLSNRPAGDLEDGLPPDLESVGLLEGTEIQILLQRVQVEGGELVWRFAPGTVSRIPTLYQRYGYGLVGELLPAPLIELHFLELRLWQWIGLALLVVVSSVLGWIAARILMGIIRPLVARTRTDVDNRVLPLVGPPLTLICALAAFVVGSHALRLSSPVQSFLAALEKGLVFAAVTWIAFRVVDVFAAVIEARMESEGKLAATAAVPMGRRAVKAFLIALAIIGVLQNLGVNVTGLLAGVGVGGLALALAAQKSIENLFGGVTLIADQPVRVGDFCRFGDGKVGTVEEIGLRSTRVRSLDRTLVTIPNSRFSEIELENFAVRDRIRLATTLGLRYETTPDQLRYVLVELRKTLIAHPRVSNDPARVRFAGFGSHSLDVEIFAYVETTDYGEFCDIREDLFLRFMDAVSSAGTGFAFPSQTLYMGRDEGLDDERRMRAEAEVAAWRAENRLPFPGFTEATVAEMNGSADWPPTGSVSHRAG